MKNKMNKIGLYLCVLIGVAVLVNALDVSISPPLEQEYTSTSVQMNVVFSEAYDTWKYSVNNKPNVTVCSYNNSETFDISYNNGSIDSSWSISGDNDIKIEFPSSLIPQKPHQNVKVCFLLYDNDGGQEESFLFQVNNGTVYSILDDASIPVGSWAWACKDINPSDFSYEYIITAWYENRFTGSGLSLANNQAVPGSHSYFDTSEDNLPSSDNITWIYYGGNVDWMINLTVITAPQECSLESSAAIEADLGHNTVTVWANSTNEIVSDSNEFWVINLADVAVSPKIVTYGESVSINAEVIADTILSVTAAVHLPNGSINTMEMLDDGSHNDGSAGDKIYGVSYTAALPGSYSVFIEAHTPYNTLNGSETFYATSSNFYILSPINGSTLSRSPITFSALLPTNVTRWGMSIDDGPNTTICSYSPPLQDVNVNFTDGNHSDAWNLNGNNDARIVFKKSDLPPGHHLSVEFCFYLNDGDWEQEESFMFQVNNRGIYSIPDNASIVAGEFHWVCKSINSSDFADSYTVDFWYSNRSTSGGVFIANDNGIPGTSSLYDNSPKNLPMTDGAYMNWVTYFDDTDWMVQAIVTADEYFCPEAYTAMLPFNPGFHKISAYMEKEEEKSSQAVNFELIDIKDITFYPKSVKPNNTINIQAHILASNISQVEAIIQPRVGLPVTVSMFDDGLHNDWGSLDGVYGVNYTPLFANPYNVTIKLTTSDNSTVQKTDFFIASNTRVAIVHSGTTLNAAIPAYSLGEMEYMEWLTSLQHLFAMAGIPFEVISEENLKDMNLIRQYDAVALPSFRNVRSTDRNQIIGNLETAVKDYGIGILAFGDLMSHDENNMEYPDFNVPLQKILNVEPTGLYDGNASTSVIVNDNAHPSAWRFEQGSELISFFDDYYLEYAVYDASEEHAYPYLVIDNTHNRTITNIIASANKKGRAFYCENPAYLVETGMGRDAILWLLFGYNPQIGVKMTDKTALFTARVDADVSYDTAQTSLAMQNYLPVMERNNMVAGWYIVTRHSGSAQVQWEQLKDDYWNLLNAGHEIGSHSVTHPADMNQLSDDAAFYEMSSSKIEIDRELGIHIKGMANPGDSPNQTRLWHISELAGYQYYSPLDDELTKGLGFVDDKVKVVNLQQNIRADYELLVDLNMTIPQTVQTWKDQYDKYYSQGDGIIIFAIWHDYNFDEIPELYGEFADYVNTTDFQGVTPGQAVDMFLEWRKQDLLINKSGTSFFITRTTPDAKYGQITLPPGSRILGINGGTYRNTTDNKSTSFAFESDTVEIVLDTFLFLAPISNRTLYENATLEISLSATYFGTGSLTYGTDAAFGSLNTTTGKFSWTPGLNDSGSYTVTFNVTDGAISHQRTAFVTVLNRALLSDNWVRLARIGGTDIFTEMSDTELNAILDERLSQKVSVVELDTKLSQYLTEEQFDQEVSFINRSAQMAHKRGLRAVIYYPSLEVITPNGMYINNTMYKDHPDWVQYGINGSPNVFYGSFEHWVDPTAESAWMSPNGPYRDYYLNRIRKLAAADVDGIWIDVPLYLETGTAWAGAGSYAAADFQNWSITKGLGNYTVPSAPYFNDSVFRAWIRWRHENLLDFLEDVRAAIHGVNPNLMVIVENFPMDYMDATKTGLDATLKEGMNNTFWIFEVDSVSNLQAMKWSNNEDFDNKIAMFKWSKEINGENPSWAFSYGNEPLDAGLTMAAAVATGNAVFETKTPNMTQTVGTDFRSRWFGFIQDNEQALLNTSRTAKVGIWYSSATRDYQDFPIGGEYGMYVTTDPPTPDPYWWSNYSGDSVTSKPHLGGWRGAAHGLTKVNIPYKIITDPGDPAPELKEVSLVWLPSVGAISNESAEILKNFTANGGIVLATGTVPGTLDEWGNNRSSSILSDLFGFTLNPPGHRLNKYGEGYAFYRPDETGNDLFGLTQDINMSNEALSTFEQIIRVHVPDSIRVENSSRVFVEVSELENVTYLYVVNYLGLQVPIVSSPQNIRIQYRPKEGLKVKSASVATPDLIGQTGPLNITREAEDFYGLDVFVDQFALIKIELENKEPPESYVANPGPLFSTPEREEAAQSGLAFILNKMRNQDAPEPYNFGVYTNLINDAGLTEIYAHGHHVTSEHMGLMLQASECMGNITAYNQSYRYIDEVMFAHDYHIVHWAIDRETRKPLIALDDDIWINSNAPLDDFRVVKGLLSGQESPLTEEILNGLYWTTVTDRHHLAPDFPAYPNGLIGYAWDWAGTDNLSLVPPANSTGIGLLFTDPIPIDYNDLYTMGLASKKDPRWKSVLVSATDLLLAAEINNSGLFYNGYEANGTFTGDFENRDTAQGNHLKTIQVLWTALHLAMASEFDSSILDETRRTSSLLAANRSLGFFKSFFEVEGRIPEYLTYSGVDVPDCPGTSDCLTRGEDNLFNGEARIYALLARLALMLDDPDLASTVIETKILTDRINNTSDPLYGLIGVSTAGAGDAEAWNVLESVLTLCMEAKRLTANNTKIIPLNQGWNLISIPLLQENNSAEEVFKGISYDGIFAYNSAWEVPTTIDYTQGYWIKSLISQNLTIQGEPIKNTSIELTPGWNLIGYPSMTQEQGNKVFADIENSLVHVFGYNGVWASNRNILTIKPGFGYWVNVNQSVSLVIS